jgi:hypothetical protein
MSKQLPIKILNKDIEENEFLLSNINAALMSENLSLDDMQKEEFEDYVVYTLVFIDEEQEKRVIEKLSQSEIGFKGSEDTNQTQHP